MKFTPYHDKIVVEPLSKKTIIQSDSDSFQEKGKVISVGSEIGSIKVGDIVYFDSYGCSRTAPDSEGNQHYLVTVTPAVIYGIERD